MTAAHGIVHVLTIVTRHDDAVVSVHRTDAGARRELYYYVADWWDEESIPAQRNPETGEPYGSLDDWGPEQAIEAYFTEMYDRESYWITEAVLDEEVPA